MPIYRIARISVTALAIAATIACGDPGPSEVVAVTSITPNVGPAGSATEVRIKGTGFKADAIVTLGSRATDVSVIDSETIVARTPVFVEGKVSVDVRNPGGANAILAGGF